MDDGQVGFRSDKCVKKVHVPKRENPIVNRLNKTKKELFPDLALEQRDRLRDASNVIKSADRERQKQAEVERRAAKERKELKSYTGVMSEKNMVSNLDQVSAYVTSEGQVDVSAFEDDFM
jgi:hypothetical protein